MSIGVGFLVIRSQARPPCGLLQPNARLGNLVHMTTTAPVRDRSEYIGARDWRRKPPPAAARDEEARHPLVLGEVRALPAHAGGADCAVHHSVGTGRVAGLLRRHGRCTECGKKGVALQHPSWAAATPGRRCRSRRWRRCNRSIDVWFSGDAPALWATAEKSDHAKGRIGQPTAPHPMFLHQRPTSNEVRYLTRFG